MTTSTARRTVRFDATRIAAVVALLSALALDVALSNRHTTAAANSTGSQATTTVTTTALAAPAGNRTSQQALLERCASTPPGRSSPRRTSPAPRSTR